MDSLLTDNAFVGIVAVGMTFAPLSGGIDINAGSMIALTGMFLAVILRDPPLRRLTAFAIDLPVRTLKRGDCRSVAQS